MHDLALVGRQFSKRLVNRCTELGIPRSPVYWLDDWRGVSHHGLFTLSPPQRAETLVADGSPQIAFLVLDAPLISSAPDEGRKHLLNNVRGDRSISKQHQGVSIQP
ncbi:MAG TPA: hypothetical protein VK504_02595, partial [Vicinamibacterales bacterium]|nr:hypothetical protein [Vicinamibacterales bacterium]